MRKINVHQLLKDMRSKSKIPIKEVSSKLSNIGYEKSSVPTLYGYENGVSMPNADIFLSMCQIYGCENPLDFYEDDVKKMSPNENHDLLNMYEKLTPQQQDIIMQMMYQLLGIQIEETHPGESSDFQAAV